jgi:hypothetical protein
MSATGGRTAQAQRMKCKQPSAATTFKGDVWYWDVENSAQLSITTVSIEFKRELPELSPAR